MSVVGAAATLGYGWGVGRGTPLLVVSAGAGGYQVGDRTGGSRIAFGAVLGAQFAPFQSEHTAVVLSARSILVPKYRDGQMRTTPISVGLRLY